MAPTKGNFLKADLSLHITVGIWFCLGMHNVLLMTMEPLRHIHLRSVLSIIINLLHNSNAIILILTLKLIGIAFEIHDAEMEAVKESKENSEEKNVIQYSRPSVADTLHYCLGHIGLITGPYYKFSTWRGLYKDSWNPAVSGVSGVCETAAMTRARWVPVHVILFLVSGNLFPLSVVETEEWQAESSLLWKLFYMAPIFFNFR